MIRRILLVATTLGGVWGALKLVEILARCANNGTRFDIWTPEATLLSIPVGLIGALLGAILGGILFPIRY